MLDVFGVDYIEGGWLGVNLMDSDFFVLVFVICVMMIVFGMIKWVGCLVQNDDVLVVVLDVGMGVVCLVGKMYLFYVYEVLGILLEDNLENICVLVVYVVVVGCEVIFDVEYFFDGYVDDVDYVLFCLYVVLDVGVCWVVLCDINGGMLLGQVGQIMQQVIVVGVFGDCLGIYCYDDIGNVVVCMLVVIDVGVCQI